MKFDLRISTFALFIAFAPCIWAAEKDKHDHDDHKPPAAKPEGHDEHKDEVKLTPEAVRRYGIRTGVAKKHTLASSFVAPARLTLNSEATAVVGSAIQGRVTELKARIGDRVKKGDELLIVESTELGEAQSDYLQKQTAIEGATAAVEPARSAAERAKALFEKSQGISLTELQKRETDYTTARSALLVAKSAADAATNKLLLLGMDQQAVDDLLKTKKLQPRFSIRSPIAGQVIERAVTMGELVKPDKDKLLVVADMSTLWVMADVPESRLREVAIGAKATITLGAVGDQTYAGTVAHIGISVDPATRSIPVRIEVKSDSLLKPGMFAQVEIASAPAGDKPDGPVLAVPEGAVQTVEGSTAVFIPVKGEANTYTARMVSVGAPVAGMLPIISGLNEGERIVTAGTFILKADLGKSSAHED